MRQPGIIRRVVSGAWRALATLVGALALALACFLVLPIIQTLGAGQQPDTVLQSVDTTQLEPPPPPPEEEEPEEEEPEEQEPPELTEEAPPLDLSQLELALNPGFSDGWLGGDFQVSLKVADSAGSDVDALFSIADLDQRPRVIHQPAPRLTPEMRRRTPATVHIIFIVDKDGRVTSPLVQRSTDPLFEKAALDAVEKWKFEPGKRNGQPVRFRMRVPITFPEGS